MNPVRDRKRFEKEFPAKESRNIMKDCGMGFEGKGEIMIPRVSNEVRKGFALITVLAVLLVIALGTATVLQAVGSHTNLKANNLSEVKYQYLAEAAIQYAQWKCRTSGCANIVSPITIDGTNVTINAAESPAGSGRYNITAIPTDYANA